MADRAIVFIDGNNWYHALCAAGVEGRGRLDYKKISEKLLGPREWVGTRYYIGQVNQKHNASLYAQQRSFLAGLTSTDPRISVHFGRIEPRTVSNEAANVTLAISDSYDAAYLLTADGDYTPAVEAVRKLNTKSTPRPVSAALNSRGQSTPSFTCDWSGSAIVIADGAREQIRARLQREQFNRSGMECGDRSHRFHFVSRFAE